MKIRGTIEHAWRGVKRWLTPVFPGLSLDVSSRRFMAFAKAKWGRDYPVEPRTVFLVGLAPWRAAIYSCAYVANHLARNSRSVLETYHFAGPRDRPLEKIYESFGARLTLQLPTGGPNHTAAEKRAREIFAGLRSKQDVLDISIDGVGLGDLIYDSYLRYWFEPTVQVEDDRLRQTIFEALLMYFATRDYLRQNKVKGLITDDYSYLGTGIPTRLAGLAGIPVYRVVFGPQFYVYQLEYASARHNVPCIPYYRFKDTFAQLSPAERESARAKGRKLLQERMAGKLDEFTLQTTTAYGEPSRERIFAETGRPRVVVMLHDFIDAPHSYRTLLFPDFVEWICFLLERAQKTPFDWYVKPHPSSGEPSREAIFRINSDVVEKLKVRFPGIHFLEPTVSNRQIAAEGISSLFTVYGTVAQEFAYMGVPVVNAGDNPHIQYDFNLHAKSVEEYESYIANADRLTVTIDKADIEEYCYMYYLYSLDEYSAGANPMDPAIFESQETLKEMAGPRALELFMSGATAEREKELNSYLDGYPRPPYSREQMAEWSMEDCEAIPTNLIDAQS